jgi:hypothetical protein
VPSQTKTSNYQRLFKHSDEHKLNNKEREDEECTQGLGLALIPLNVSGNSGGCIRCGEHFYHRCLMFHLWQDVREQNIHNMTSYLRPFLESQAISTS